ncbi:MAG: VCBS repeat-containing protein [bacterium]|nr:VCBS repeat-containing protein [bacterium]
MPLRFRKVLIADERFEAAGLIDVNNDGKLDIVSGAYWYEGPDFKKVHPIGEVQPSGEYFDDFSNIPIDVNGDGLMDYITGAWFTGTLRWRENPGDPNKEWPLHDIDACGNIERAMAWDIDGDGRIEIIPNCPPSPLAIYKLKTGANGKGAGEFQKTVIRTEKQGHGIGFGDINGDGRPDIVLNNGWLEAPADPYKGEWIWHPEFKFCWSASTPMLVADVNGDGLSDIIVGGGHEYGLDWWEQRLEGGKRTWVRHPIDPFNSQYHDMQWIDIDGDGKKELLTGKRYRAHCGKDPGARDDVGIYYFKWNGESFTKLMVDYGPTRVGKGCGIYFATADLTGNGLPDIVAPGKDGLYVFYNEGMIS